MWTSIILILIEYSLYELMIRDHDILSRLRVGMIYTHVRSGRIWWSSIHDLSWFARLSFQWLIPFSCLLEFCDEFWIEDHFWKKKNIYVYIYILCTDYQRLHVHLADLILWWSNPTSCPFLFHDIKSQSMEMWLYRTGQWFFFHISAESVAEISYHSQSRYRELYFNCCYAVRWTLTWIWSCQRIVLIQRSDIASISGSLIRSVILFWEIVHSNSIASPSIPENSLGAEYILNWPTWMVHFSFVSSLEEIILPRHNTESELTRTFAFDHFLTWSRWSAVIPTHFQYYRRIFHHEVFSDGERSLNILKVPVFEDLHILLICQCQMDCCLHRKRYGSWSWRPQSQIILVLPRHDWFVHSPYLRILFWRLSYSAIALSVVESCRWEKQLYLVFKFQCSEHFPVFSLGSAWHCQSCPIQSLSLARGSGIGLWRYWGLLRVILESIPAIQRLEPWTLQTPKLLVWSWLVWT